MKVRLTQRTRIWHESGETVNVSPAEAAFLLSVHAAETVADKKTEKRKNKTDCDK